MSAIPERVIYAVQQSMMEQKPNGSWFYGGNSHRQFIDSFHTGYCIEALNEVSYHLSMPGLDDAISKAKIYYREAFIEEGGLVKYYDNTTFPIDIYCFA